MSFFPSFVLYLAPHMNIYRERLAFPQTAIFDISHSVMIKMDPGTTDVLFPLPSFWNYMFPLRWFSNSLPTKHIFPETMSVQSLAYYEHVYSRKRLAFSQISNLNIFIFCSKFDWYNLCPSFSSDSQKAWAASYASLALCHQKRQESSGYLSCLWLFQSIYMVVGQASSLIINIRPWGLPTLIKSRKTVSSFSFSPPSNLAREDGCLFCPWRIIIIYHCAARACFHVNLHFRHLNLLLKVWLRKPMSIILSGLRNLMSKMHVCLSLHPNRLGINACLFSLRPSIRIFIIPRRVLPLVIICTFNISTFCSKFNWESVCLASSLVF